MFNQCTQHERHDKITSLQLNTVVLPSKQFKEERKLIKLLTKPISLRPSIPELLTSNELLSIKDKYKS